MTDFFPLFGPARADEWQQSPLGIHYNARGFDRLPNNEKRQRKAAKRLKKALAWMTAQNVPTWVQNEFSAYFRALPTELPSWLDSAFLWLQQERWQPCLSKYPALGRIKPGDIRITLEPVPIYVPYFKKYTAGIMEPSKNGAISLVVAALSKGTPGSDELNWLRRVDHLCKYEMGNYAAHYVLKLDPAKREVGDGAIC